jgi:hypothetical protein
MDAGPTHGQIVTDNLMHKGIMCFRYPATLGLQQQAAKSHMIGRRVLC